MIINFILKVAIVDDDTSTLRLLEGLLSTIGRVEVNSFENPVTALEEIRREDYHLLITDLKMKEMLGNDLIREVSSLRKGIISIIITSRKTFMDSHSCFRAGAWDYLLKPVSREQLFSTMREIITHFDRWNDIFREISTKSHGHNGSKLTESFDPHNYKTIDLDAILYTLDNDQQLLRDISNQFIENCTQLVDEIKNSLDVGDIVSAKRVAHQLKGSASNFHAKRVVDLAEQLELLDSGKNLDRAASLFSSLQDELVSMISELKTFSRNGENL